MCVGGGLRGVGGGSVCCESVSGLLKTALCAVSLFQVQGDLEDLESVLGDGDIRRLVGTGSCSALVKLLPGNRDLYVAQDTWNGYESMLRILKVYKFPWKTLANGTGEAANGNFFIICTTDQGAFLSFALLIRELFYH